MIISTISNIVLDILFVVGFQWGVIGAAAATVISQLLSALYCFTQVKMIAVAKINFKNIRPDLAGHIQRPETPFMYVRDFLDIDEFCVDEACRRRGVASAMIDFAKAYAKERGYHRLELNMWEFNRDALAFYEAAGFTTFRRYMEMML